MTSPEAPAHLDIGRTLERMLAVYREQAGVLIPLALLVFIPATLLQALVYGTLGYGLIVSVLVAIVVTIAVYLYEGMVVQSVHDLEDGVRDLTMSALARSVRPVLLPVIAASLVAGVGVSIGLALLIVPGLILLTLWAVVIPVIVIERLGVIDAFGRSQRLVRASALQVFAVLVVLFLVQLALTFVFSLIFVSAFGIVTGFSISNLVVNTLVAPLFGIAVTVVYLELRRLEDESTAAAAAPPGGAPPTEGERTPQQ